MHCVLGDCSESGSDAFALAFPELSKAGSIVPFSPPGPPFPLLPGSTGNALLSPSSHPSSLGSHILQPPSPPSVLPTLRDAPHPQNS